MADVKAGQKVRLWDGSNEFGFTNSNPVFVRLTDGTDDSLIDASGNLNVVVNGTVTVSATDLDIRDLSASQDNVAISDGTDTLAVNTNGSIDVETPFNVDSAAGGTDAVFPAGAIRDDALTTLTPADGDYTNLRVDSTGALWVNDTNTANIPSKADDSAFTIASDNVSPAGYLADETTPDSVDEGDVGLARMTLDRKQIMVIADATTDSQRLAIDSSGNAQVDIGAVSVTAVPVSADSNANSETNPIYVQVVTTGVSASEIHDYDTASAIAADATDNHDYTVAGTTFLLKSVIVSASSAGKWEIQTGPVASLTTDAVVFTTEAKPTEQVVFDPPIEVPATSTGTVRIIRTNRDNQAQDLYSTIIGNDV